MENVYIDKRAYECFDRQVVTETPKAATDERSADKHN